MMFSLSSTFVSKTGRPHISQYACRGWISCAAQYSIEIAHWCESAYFSCASICSSVRSGRNEKVPCVILIAPPLVADRRHELHVGRVGGLEVERDVLPDLQRRIELGAA